MLSGEHAASIVSKKHQEPKPKSKTLHSCFLEVLDVVLSCLLVAPCVIAYWRGTWEILGILIFPHNTPLSALASFLIGGTGHFIFISTQSVFKAYIHPDKRRLTYYVISRCYTATFGVICVNMWRGSWVLCDWLTSADSLMIVSIVTLIALLFLTATRTLRNLGAAPYTVAMDHKSDYFDVDTMFKVPGFHQPGLYILDTLFSVFVIGTLVVIAWRGLWGIMDLTFFTNDFSKSAWGSVIIGYVTTGTTFIIQPMVRFICKRVNGACKLFICDIFYMMCFVGAVNAWRGIWMLLDLYVYPDNNNRVFFYWLTNVIPFLILAAFKCSNSILVRGVFIDGEDIKGECIDIPIHYTMLHFQRERNKKQSILHPFNNHRQQRHQLGNNNEKEAKSSLLEKDTKPEPKIVSGMDATQLV